MGCWADKCKSEAFFDGQILITPSNQAYSWHTPNAAAIKRRPQLSGGLNGVLLQTVLQYQLGDIE